MWHQGFNRNFTKLQELLYSTIHLLRITLVSFWRVSTERKQRMLFYVSCATRIRCFRSDKSLNNVAQLTQNSIHCSVLRSFTEVLWAGNDMKLSNDWQNFAYSWQQNDPCSHKSAKSSKKTYSITHARPVDCAFSLKKNTTHLCTYRCISIN